MITLIVIAVLAVALAMLLAAFYRISKNVGPLGLEDYARRARCVFIPISTDLVAELQDWSKPVRLKVEPGRHPLLIELQLNTKIDPEV